MGDSSAVPAAEQALGILSYMARQRGPVTAAAIANALAVPRSTTYHLLSVLIRQGFVTHLSERRRYGLGVSALELGTGYARQEPLAQLGRPLVETLARTTGANAHLAVMHGTDVLYIVEERPRRAPRLVSGLGVRLPAHLTASGRAMLSAMPTEQFWALYPDREMLVERTGRGPRTVAELRDWLRTARARGYATEVSEVTQGLVSVGLPVLDHLGWPTAAIALTFPEADGRALDEVADEIRPASQELSRRIGGVPARPLHRDVTNRP
ncbi:IclR family transcriptional regulator [Ruicaihuangia caeni]|uniref:IclR family transcriptional regulator n=1 Tax=Ruicaihuangia caeni TaxID=3042517 RepID=UPI00338EDD73